MTDKRQTREELIAEAIEESTEEAKEYHFLLTQIGFQISRKDRALRDVVDAEESLEKLLAKAMNLKCEEEPK